MHIMATAEQMVRGNRGLNSSVSQSRVVIRFKAPQPRYLVTEFLRAKLRPSQLKAGETLRESTFARTVGVVGVELPSDAILNPLAEPKDQVIERFHLVLDRRYSTETLAAVYRTAGMIGDLLGAGIK